jgi:hypothetical protein
MLQSIDVPGDNDEMSPMFRPQLSLQRIDHHSHEGMAGSASSLGDTYFKVHLSVKDKHLKESL